MLNQVKAVILGIISILIFGLINQLVLIISLVGFNSLIKSYPSLASWNQIFTYFVGGIGFAIVMLIGGFVCAMLAKKNVYRLSAIASIIGSTTSLYLSLQNEIFTIIAFLFIALGVLSSLLGSKIWLRNFG